MKTITRKIGLNKGKRRIWLEGAVLTSAGFKHGTRFNVVNTDNVLSIYADLNGKRKVAGKPGREIIDMTAATITASFADTVKVVEIVKGSGVCLILKGIK